MSDSNCQIVFDNVSKFYGEVLGVNRVSMVIEPGITSLVGPNGAGKSTLLNLAAGLLRPTQGRITLFGHSIGQPEAFYRQMGYCTQFDAFPKGLCGLDLVLGYLRVHGYGRAEAEALAWEAIRKVNLADAARRKVAAYSKGMRQRIKLAQAISHRPQALLLDEPLNGLDPMARAEVTALFRQMADEGRTVIVSSHILHEVDAISDRVILMNNGYIVAEGGIHHVREEVPDHPLQILVRCDRPSVLAARVFEQDHAVEAKLHPDGRGVFVRTRDAGHFYLLLNRLALSEKLNIEAVEPTDEDVNSLYEYLITQEGGRS